MNWIVPLILFLSISSHQLRPSLANSYIYLSDKIIQEEISIGSLIVDISEQVTAYQLTSKRTRELSNDNQQYTFLDDHKSSTENTYFLLDSVTGRVMSKRYLDRESMCLNKHLKDKTIGLPCKPCAQFWHNPWVIHRGWRFPKVIHFGDGGLVPVSHMVLWSSSR